MVWTVRLGMDSLPSAIARPVRRLEVFTEAGGRRKWSNEDKALIVAEIAASGDAVCEVARRHGSSPQQFFGWRRQLREKGRPGVLKRKKCSSCRRWWMWARRRLLLDTLSERRNQKHKYRPLTCDHSKRGGIRMHGKTTATITLANAAKEANRAQTRRDGGDANRHSLM